MTPEDVISRIAPARSDKLLKMKDFHLGEWVLIKGRVAIVMSKEHGRMVISYLQPAEIRILKVEEDIVAWCGNLWPPTEWFRKITIRGDLKFERDHAKVGSLWRVSPAICQKIELKYGGAPC